MVLDEKDIFVPKNKHSCITKQYKNVEVYVLVKITSNSNNIFMTKLIKSKDFL